MFDLFNRKNYISQEEVKSKLDGKNLLLIDVRSTEEYKEKRIPNSISVPLNILEKNIGKYAACKDEEIIVYCLSGARASSACSLLSKMGYTNVKNLGGIMRWPFETISG